MPPPTAGSLFAVCCRCQFRAAFGARRVAAFRPHAAARLASTTSTPSPPPPPKTKAGQELIVLPPPRGRGPSELPEAPAISPLDVIQLAELQNVVLTYVSEVDLDTTKMEISLSKPLNPRVSKERYEQLFNQLAAAFNVTQLRAYYDTAPPSDSKTRRLMELKRAANKADVLNAIMKDRWGMEIAEEIKEREDVIVEKEIQVTRREIFFLIGEDGRILREWAQQCAARITVDVAKSLLTLSASQVSIEEIEKRLRHVFGNIINEEFDLTGISRLVPFSEEPIPVIARMTNTYIERIDDKKLRISGLGDKKTGMEDARRLLLVAMNIPFRTKERLLYNPPMATSAKGALYPASELLSLPWIYRNRQWGRYKTVAKKPDDQNSWAGLKPYEMVLKAAKGDRGYINAIPDFLSAMGGPISPYLASAGLHSSYEATLGHLLYEINTDDYNLRAERYESEIDNFMKTFSERQRLLCNVFPGIPAFSQDPIRRADFAIPAPALMGASTREHFQLRFMPSPWARPTTFERYPPLRMTANIRSDTGELELPAFYALAGENHVDVMLPTSPCDIRFTRRDEVALGVRTPEELEELGCGVEKAEWERFLDASSLNLFHDSQLHCASTLTAHVPEWLIDGPSLGSPEIAHPGPVEYTFTGLEYRRVVTLEQRGYLLQRTLVEGGISGGRRTEVKLVYIPPQAVESESAAADAQFLAFCEVALGMLLSVEGNRIAAARERSQGRRG